MINIADLPVRNFNEANTTRLISTAYIDEPALAPLADDEDELKFLEELEGLSSSRRGLPEFIPAGVNPNELLGAYDGYGWTYVNAAFCYTRETGNRFNGPDRGAWYASWGEARVETAQAEVAWHLTRELEATGIYENVTAYRELNASFTTQLHDLKNLHEQVFLDPEPSVAYPAGQRLASELLAADSNGIMYPSTRKVGGSCLVAFRPHLIQNIRQGNCWVFIWAGTTEPVIKPFSFT